MGIKYCVPQTVHMDTTPEKRMKFAEVIIRKCDEVSALTNDLFLHALSDMDSVRLILPDSEWVISADEKRLMQLTENILNNAAKYGEMPVDITIRQKDNDTVQINFKDYGNRMKDEDIPFALIVVIMFCHRMFLQEKTDLGILKPMGITHLIISLHLASVLFPIGLICVSFFLFAFLVSRGIKKLSTTVLIAE